MEHAGVKKARFPVFRDKFVELQGSMTDVEFGKKLGISRQTVGFYRNGDRIPDALGLRDIAQKCGVSADYLLGLTECPAVDDKAKAACEYTGLSAKAVQILNSSFCNDNSIYGPDCLYNVRNLMDDIIISQNIFDTLRYIYGVKTTAEKIFSLVKPIQQEKEETQQLVNDNTLGNLIVHRETIPIAHKLFSDLVVEKVCVTETIERFIDKYANYSEAREMLEKYFYLSMQEIDDVITRLEMPNEM